jgi:hypothetical protein
VTKFIRSQAFDVFQRRRCPVFHSVTEEKIDTVFYHEHPKMTVDDVRRQLIDHDGYPSDIMVRKAE